MLCKLRDPIDVKMPWVFYSWLRNLVAYNVFNEMSPSTELFCIGIHKLCYHMSNKFVIKYMENDLQANVNYGYLKENEFLFILFGNSWKVLPMVCR